MSKLNATEVLQAALDAGFMIHTGYGQDQNKLMPVSDAKTLVRFYQAAKRMEEMQAAGNVEESA